MNRGQSNETPFVPFRGVVFPLRLFASLYPFGVALWAKQSAETVVVPLQFAQRAKELPTPLKGTKGYVLFLLFWGNRTLLPKQTKQIFCPMLPYGQSFFYPLWFALPYPLWGVKAGATKGFSSSPPVRCLQLRPEGDNNFVVVPLRFAVALWAKQRRTEGKATLPFGHLCPLFYFVVFYTPQRGVKPKGQRKQQKQ